MEPNHQQNNSQDKPQFNVKDRRHWVLEDQGEIEAAETEERLPTYVQKLKEEAEEKDRRLREYIAAYKTKTAETEEIRLRLQRETEGRLEQAKAVFFKQILPVLDNLKRALDSARNTNDFESLLKGMEMIVTQFERELLNQGIQTIDTVGQKFDPKAHEVLMTEETTDPAQEDMILEELEPGYQLKDKLIKPAKVKVAKLKI